MVGEVLFVAGIVGRSRSPALGGPRSDGRWIRGRERPASRRWTRAHRALGIRVLEKRQQLARAGLENGWRDLTPRRWDKSGPPCLANRPSSLVAVCEMSDPDGPGGGKEGRLAVRRSSSPKAPRVNQTLESLSQNSGGYCQESRCWFAALTFFAGGRSCESWSASCLFRVRKTAIGGGVMKKRQTRWWWVFRVGRVSGISRPILETKKAVGVGRSEELSANDYSRSIVSGAGAGVGPGDKFTRTWCLIMPGGEAPIGRQPHRKAATWRACRKRK